MDLHSAINECGSCLFVSNKTLCPETFRFTMKKIHKFKILVISFYFEMLTKEPNMMCPVSQALLSI